MSERREGRWKFFADTRHLSRRRPTRYWYERQPYAVVPQKDGGFRVFEDRCPHRNYALSEGRVQEDGGIVCAYHGWTFSSDGLLRRRPGFTEEKAPPYCLKTFKTAIAGELLFVWDGPGMPAELPPWMRDLNEPGLNSFRYTQTVRARKLFVLENLLDPFHTHFIHVPFLRSDRDRHPVDVTAKFSSEKGELELVYSGEPTPTGLVSRFFESKREKTVGRYIDADTAVLEYWTERGLDLRVTLAVSEAKEGLTQGSLVFQSPKGKIPFPLVRPLYRFMTGFLVRQDHEALELQEKTWGEFPTKEAWVSQEDHVYKVIQKLQASERVDDFERSYRLMI